MATAILNPIITEITGRMGNLVFYRRHNTQCLRTYVIPRNPDTSAQKIVRNNFAEAVKSWQSMTPDEKYKFTRKARNLQMSGYNLYISTFIKTKALPMHIFNSAVKPLLTIPRIHSVSNSNIIRDTSFSAFTPIKHFLG